MVMTTADKTIYSIGIGGTGVKTIDALSLLGNTQGRNDVPLTDIIFLLDCTRSMADKLGQIKGFINNFTEKLVSQANDTRLGLIEFRDRQMGEDHQVHTFESTTNPFTQDLTLFNHTLDNLEAEGGFGYEASGLDAILFALNQPFREESKKVIVLFTDGNPRFPDVETKTIKQVATAIEEVGAQFYVVSLSGSSIADDALNLCKSEMASSTIASMAGDLFKKSEYSKYLNKILKLAGKQSDFQVYQKLVRKVEGEFFNYDEDETKLMNNLLCCSLIGEHRSEVLTISANNPYVRRFYPGYWICLEESSEYNRGCNKGYEAGFNDCLNRGFISGYYWIFLEESSEYNRGYNKGYQLAKSINLKNDYELADESIITINLENDYELADDGNDILSLFYHVDVLRPFTSNNDNIWKNIGEIAGTGIDDDGNSYVDDVYGWNTVNNNNDTLYRHSNDSIIGDQRNNILYGGGGSNILYGEDGHDILYGRDGRDIFYGGDVNDTLHGGTGNDSLGTVYYTLTEYPYHENNLQGEELDGTEVQNYKKVEQVYTGSENDATHLIQRKNLAKKVYCNNFQDAQAFFDNGGQVGRPIDILSSGTYEINSDLFKISQVPPISIGTDEIGLVEALDGFPLESGQNLAKVVECDNFQDIKAFFNNGGQAGKQLATLEPGKYDINPEIFTIRKVPIIRINQEEIGLVIANEGASKSNEQTLGKVVECNHFQNASAFLKNGGQKGKQLAILTEGDYKINTDLFTVITTANAHEYNENPNTLKIYKIDSGKVGIVTTTIGKTLHHDEIAGRVIEGHDNYQDPQKFLNLGRYKGLPEEAEEVLLEGVWKLNPWFVNVEQVSMTIIEQQDVPEPTSKAGEDKIEFDDSGKKKYPAIRNLVSRVSTKVVSCHLRQAAAARSAIEPQEQRGNIEKTGVQEYKKYLQSKISYKLWRELIMIRIMNISSMTMSQLWKSFISQSQLNLTSKIYYQYAQLRASPNLPLEQNLMMTKKIKLKKEIPKIASSFISPYKDYRFSLRL